MRRRIGSGTGTLLVALLASLAILDGQAQEARALRSTLDLQVPMAPAVIGVDGEPRLVYELHITNFAAADLSLKRIEVLDADGQVLGSLIDAELASALSRPAGLPDGADARQLATGSRAIAYLWLALGSDRSQPRHIRHRLEFDLVRSGKHESVVMESVTVSVRLDAPIILAPPLRGGPWAAVYEPSMEWGHRQVFYAINGRARLPARFAIDWVKVDQDGKSFSGDKTNPANWHGYGAEVLAVADAVVAAARDGIAESNTLPDGSRPRNSLEKASGNYIALDLGQGHFAFYEHLKPGSVMVKVGERVRRGQPIAALGSTGDSMGPHLHFHVSDASSTLAAEGLPYVLESFELVGAYDSIEDFGNGARWKPLQGNPSASRSAELPGANVVVRFPY